MDIFKQLGYYQEKKEIIPFKYIINKSLMVSIEIILILIIIYLIVYFFNLTHLIYNLF